MDSSVFASDFDSLTVGDGFTTRGRTITEADIVGFATLTGDMHPQHTDATWAAAGSFGERIAHGLLVVSYAIGLLPLDPARVVALRRVRDAVFKRPVAIGDTIHAEGRIERLDEVDSEVGIAGIRIDVVNQRSRVAVRVAVDVVWRRGEAPRAAPGDVFELAGLPL